MLKIDPYEILNLEKLAGQKEIRAAYYQLLHKHSPERDPLGFQRLRKAYEILSNSKARAFYDQMLEHGEEAGELFLSAQNAIDSKEWPVAIRLLKYLLVLVPSHEQARCLLALSFYRAEEWAEAADVFKRVTQEEPADPSYWMCYGWCHFRLGNLAENHYERISRLKAARSCFLLAHNLQLFQGESLVAISRTFLETGEQELAFEWAERALDAYINAEFEDLYNLSHLCLIFALSNDTGLLNYCIDLMIKIPLSKGQSKEAAEILASTATRLLRERQAEASLNLIEYSVLLQPKDEELQNLALRIKLSARAMVRA